MNPNYQNILAFLKQNNISYQEAEHEVVNTCEDSARVRSELGMVGAGSKNIFFHAKGKFFLVVTLATKDIKARRFKPQVGTKDIRFATADETKTYLDAVSGSVPPFGFANVEVPIFVDEDILESETFIFNPSDPTRSIALKSHDLMAVYKNLPNPVIYFRAEEEETIFTPKESYTA